MSAPLLEIVELMVSYGGIVAVNRLSLIVNPGEIVALLGANGAGKSSTLSAVAGAVAPSSGDIKLRGHSLLRLAPHDRVAQGIVLCPEGRRIFPRLSVYENLLAGGFLAKDARQLQSRIEQVVALFPILQERLRQPGRTLSGGEQQMLAIARALMANPKLLLLDEPSLGLAPKGVQTIFKQISLLRATGVSMLLVEQNANAALQLADRAYIMETGRIIIEGTARELVNDAAVRAAYLGG